MDLGWRAPAPLIYLDIVWSVGWKLVKGLFRSTRLFVWQIQKHKHRLINYNITNVLLMMHLGWQACVISLFDLF